MLLALVPQPRAAPAHVRDDLGVAAGPAERLQRDAVLAVVVGGGLWVAGACGCGAAEERLDERPQGGRRGGDDGNVDLDLRPD